MRHTFNNNNNELSLCFKLEENPNLENEEMYGLIYNKHINILFFFLIKYFIMKEKNVHIHRLVEKIIY